MNFSLTVSDVGFSITANGEEMDGLTSKVLGAAAVLRGSAAVAVPQPEAPKGAKRGPKPKEAPAPQPEPIQTDIEEVVSESQEAAVSHDDVINELKNVNAKFGMQAVRDIIKPFGAEAIKNLKPEDWAGVVAAAKAKLA